MGTTARGPRERVARVNGVSLHAREWLPAEESDSSGRLPVLLLHGLASASRIWDLVAPGLAQHRHVVALDQRGHGRSEKPDDGYDFATIVSDDLLACDALGLGGRFHVAGHSWGGNVAVELAAAHPDRIATLTLVDGGFGMLRQRPGATWETISRELAPPDFAGTPRDAFLARVRAGNPMWRPELDDILLNIVELRADDTVGPRLARANHMKILRAMWDEDADTIYPAIRCPTLFILAQPAGTDSRGAQFLVHKRRGVEMARGLMSQSPSVEVVWMPDTIHDIPLQRPDELVRQIADFVGGAE